MKVLVTVMVIALASSCVVYIIEPSFDTGLVFGFCIVSIALMFLLSNPEPKEKTVKAEPDPVLMKKLDNILSRVTNTEINVLHTKDSVAKIAALTRINKVEVAEEDTVPEAIANILEEITIIDQVEKKVEKAEKSAEKKKPPITAYTSVTNGKKKDEGKRSIPTLLERYQYNPKARINRTRQQREALEYLMDKYPAKQVLFYYDTLKKAGYHKPSLEAIQDMGKEHGFEGYLRSQRFSREDKEKMNRIVEDAMIKEEIDALGALRLLEKHFPDKIIKYFTAYNIIYNMVGATTK